MAHKLVENKQKKKNSGPLHSMSNTGFLKGPSAEPPKPVLTPSYFSEHKKTEINDLREALVKTMNGKRDEEKRQIMTKIIQSMTHGMNLSDLFQNIALVPYCSSLIRINHQASHTQDVVLKKMVYLYLNNYAKENETLAMMAINSILRDTTDDNPVVRGLALRWLSSLGFTNFMNLHFLTDQSEPQHSQNIWLNHSEEV